MAFAGFGNLLLISQATEMLSYAGWLNRVAGGVEMVSQFSAQTADQV